MKFTKMHGIGNDYVYVNCFKETVENPSEVSKFVSDRHFGIGSDGLILIKPSEVADCYMEMYNADGSRSAMCGNGIRCVAKYIYDYGLTDKTEVDVETAAGIKHIVLTIKDGKVEKARVDMGEPILKPELVPVIGEGDMLVNEPIMVDGTEYRMTCVSMGNPHAVVFLDEDVKNLEIEKIGPKFENHERFPERVNTEFMYVLDRNTMNLRVWERGSGETWACGTGTCASVVASVLNGLTERNVLVHLLGGDLEILWDEKDNHVYMTGPAATVFDGEIELP
ncbi:MAG: diaminopimelate epimerase [Lachnospiraceae bacterium]|nr:diaminopimelate epimerase [Lachnospiraceae bacterium]MEE1014975.1 diaminopimelate epimerase [Lachnospiraceae bacterium]